MKVFNRLTKQKEDFIPVNSDQVGMYICGLTVQDKPHIGHIRSFMSADIMRRYLEYRGFRVKHVQNFTDVDDKIIARAHKEGVDYSVIANRYINEYFHCIEKLNLLPAHVYPRATQEIPAITKLIQTLVDKEHAYQSGDDVFFAVDSYADYGQLSGRKTEDLLTGTRFEVDDKKQNPLDFALWKAAKPGEPSWESPFGPGRPGWHIECSAMAIKYLGESFDFHGGGLDLIFPHHENEKAQSECATGRLFAKYWVESGLLNTGGEKMSKSLGNFFAISDLLEKYTANELRFFLVSKHYRSPLEYSVERLEEARASFARIQNGIVAAYHMLCEIDDDTLEFQVFFRHAEMTEDIAIQYTEAMDDDFNTAAVTALIFNCLKDININVQRKLYDDVKTRLNSLLCILKLMGFVIDLAIKPDTDLLDRLMACVIDWRRSLREEKNWKMADLIRDDLADLGITLKDLADRTVWEMNKR